MQTRVIGGLTNLSSVSEDFKSGGLLRQGMSMTSNFTD